DSEHYPIVMLAAVRYLHSRKLGLRGFSPRRNRTGERRMLQSRSQTQELMLQNGAKGIVRSRVLVWLVLPALLGFCAVSAVAQSIAYVPTHKSNSVSVINTADNTVIAVIPVGI